MTKEIIDLIDRIQNCDLPQEDKRLLVEILSADELDFDRFIKQFLLCFKAAAVICKAFHIDIGDFF